jgi:FAD/FMN-containing dehydrogenase
VTFLLDPPTIRDFAGAIVAPGDPEYDTARQLQNAAIDRRPALIARCAGPHDIAAALRHARAEGLAVTVRGGGHAPGGFAVGDGALMIDLSGMRAVHVDPARRVARVQGGALVRDLDAATQAHGLAVTGGRVPTVGVAGFTLGSGSGWLERKLGVAADSLRAARVVTADGDLVTACADSDADLFWALRGGGPGFAIAAELEFELAPVGPVVVGGLIGWRAERTAEVADAYARLIAAAPDDLGGGLGLLSGPPAPFIPAALHGAQVVVVAVLWTGEHAEADAQLAPLRALAPDFDGVAPIPYAAFQGMFERPASEQVPTRSYAEGGFLGELTPELVTALAQVARERPSELGSILLQPLGGAFARVPEDATPLGRRAAAWHFQAGSAWVDPAMDDASRAWARSVRAAAAPWSAGETYPNFLPDSDPERLRAAFAPTTWERLRAIRADWDPDGILSAGQAIPLPGRRSLGR